MAYKQDRAYLRRFASSAAGIAWVLIFALVLSLPIVLGVLKSDAVYQLNEKQDELYLLEKTEERLRAEFESGLDLREIESIAVNEIGMIKLNDSTIRVLRLNDFDSIESFSDKKANSVVPALLSALGFRIGNE
jgi:Na+-transporting NADH:ubiquinone oxidoreductase subunit NqrC